MVEFLKAGFSFCAPTVKVKVKVKVKDEIFEWFDANILTLIFQSYIFDDIIATR